MRLNISYLPLHSTHKKSNYCLHKLRYLIRRKGCLILSITLFTFMFLFVHYYNFIFTILYCVSFIQEDSIADHLTPVRINTVNARLPLCSLFDKHTSLYPEKFIFNASTYNSTATRLNIKSGGAWEPEHCIVQHRVALIVPYRDRDTQLKIFLTHIHEFLQKQAIAYQIFVIEQTQGKAFNRGKLFNIGFVEASKASAAFHCFIFHDVDLLPLNPNNIYACTREPRHMSVAVNTFDYQLPYCTIFGGAVAMLGEQFQRVNGFSNSYFGWGGEDDDLFQRLSNYYSICRFSPQVSKYVMLSHKKQEAADHRLETLDNAPFRFKTDGLNTLHANYTKTNYTLLSLETRIVVNL